MTPAALAGYEAAVTRAAFAPQPEAGYLRILGPDRQDFLQRQSTNDLRILAPGRTLVTVLTTPAARILDVLTLFEDGFEAIAALSLPGQAAGTYQYLKSRVFFMDKVTLEDESAAFAQFILTGPQADGALQHLGLEQAPGEGQLVRLELEGAPLSLFPDGQLGFRLLSPAGIAGQVQEALESAGAELLSPQSVTALRVENGLPAAGAELTGEYTPLEAGLGWAVSDSKGCYTGQEVIARQLTYDKVTQRLVGLRLISPAVPGDRLVEPGEDRPAGRLTSAVVSPRFGPIALAIVRRPHDAPGTRLALSIAPETLAAIVTTLPFSPSDS